MLWKRLFGTYDSRNAQYDWGALPTSPVAYCVSQAQTWRWQQQRTVFWHTFLPWLVSQTVGTHQTCMLSSFGPKFRAHNVCAHIGSTTSQAGSVVRLGRGGRLPTWLVVTTAPHSAMDPNREVEGAATAIVWILLLIATCVTFVALGPCCVGSSHRDIPLPAGAFAARVCTTSRTARCGTCVSLR